MAKSLEAQYDSAVGALVGAAVGDALGAPLEFLPPRERDNFTTDMTGGGMLKWEPGSITDDTIMSMSICGMYLECGGYDQKNLVEKWLNWKKTGPKDIGNWTNRALGKWAQIFDTLESGVGLRGQDHPVIQLWNNMGQDDAGNGGVMRCMPSAVANINYSQMAKDTINICQDTHPDPRCVESCLAINSAIFYLIENKLSKSKLMEVIPKGKGELADALKESPGLPWEEWTNDGFTVDTVRCAFACFLQANDFEKALIEVVNRGNDADTVGAVAGSLLGAYYGYKAIPQRWIMKLQQKNAIQEVAKGMFLYRINQKNTNDD